MHMDNEYCKAVDCKSTMLTKINISKSAVTGDDEANERMYQQISGRRGAPARGLSRPSSGDSDAPNTLRI